MYLYTRLKVISLAAPDVVCRRRKFRCPQVCPSAWYVCQISFCVYVLCVVSLAASNAHAMVGAGVNVPRGVLRHGMCPKVCASDLNALCKK